MSDRRRIIIDGSRPRHPDQMLADMANWPVRIRTLHGSLSGRMRVAGEAVHLTELTPEEAAKVDDAAQEDLSVRLVDIVEIEVLRGLRSGEHTH